MKKETLEEQTKQDFYKIGDFHEHCDDGCKYNCTKGNTQLAECLEESIIETLIEYAENYAKKWNDLENQFKLSSCFIAGAMWQQKKMYSEEDMQEYVEFCIECLNQGLPPIVAKDWFNLYKKEII
jgi:hypothetical protein